MVKVNGKTMDISGITLSEYLKTADYDSERVAVERNHSIVPKALYLTTVLEEDDEIEIVCFVGGG